jgi:hypothetical protein
LIDRGIARRCRRSRLDVVAGQQLGESYLMTSRNEDEDGIEEARR